MNFADRLTLDAPRRTKDGFLAVRARAARTGVYRYSGTEVDPENAHGLRDVATVNVLRDEDAVFAPGAIRSFIGKPITDDHPADAVTPANWRDHARGTIMGAIRDGEYLAFDLLLTDAAAIEKVDGGKRELSNGYTSDLQFGEFTAADGTVCQARQTSITGNHIALVDRGRAGPECRIADGWAACDANPAALADHQPKGSAVKKIVLDGLQVDLADADAVAAAISKLQDNEAKAVTARDKALADVATLTTDKAALEAKVTTLEKQVADAQLTPQQLRDAARAYQATADKAKALGVTVSDEMDGPAMMKAAVLAKLGDAAKDWSDVQFAASFATLTAGAQVADAIHNIPAPRALADAETSFADTQRKLSEQRRNAWKNPAPAAAA